MPYGEGIGMHLSRRAQGVEMVVGQRNEPGAVFWTVQLRKAAGTADRLDLSRNKMIIHPVSCQRGDRLPCASLGSEHAVLGVRISQIMSRFKLQKTNPLFSSCLSWKLQMSNAADCHRGRPSARAAVSAPRYRSLLPSRIRNTLVSAKTQGRGIPLQSAQAFGVDAHILTVCVQDKLTPPKRTPKIPDFWQLRQIFASLLYICGTKHISTDGAALYHYGPL